MRSISAPGIYLDIAASDYHRGLLPAPALSQSTAKILLDRSPLHAWHAHSRLNPDYQHDDSTRFDIGNVSHKKLIGRGKEIVALDAPDWNATGMGNGAKTALHEARDAANADGKIAVLGKTASRADAMVSSAREQLDLRGLGHLFAEGQGHGEVMLAWQESDIWLQQLVDWLTPDYLTFCDYKSTKESASPHALARKMVNDGWHIQAAMAERGLDTLHPQSAGRRQYLFIVQEDTRPYALSVVAITEGALTIGRKMLDRAADIWRECITNDRWPGYPMEITAPQIPGWYETAAMEREIEHSERKTAIPHDILMAG